MANFYTDNPEIKFQLNHPLMKRIVELKERSFADKDEYDYAPQNFEDAIDSYDRVLELTGDISANIIAPNAESMKGLDPSFAQIGVKYITNAKIRHHDLGDGRSRKEFVWVGKYYKDLDIINITRNGAFEQVDAGHDWVNECMADIESAFRWHKPCVISSHRVNYIGGIDERNAAKGLQLLDELLTRIEKKWPDVEYMTSTEVGDIIRKEKGL